MKITYYPDIKENEQYKITGEHSSECLKKYNEERSDKKKYLDEYESFKEMYF